MRGLWCGILLAVASAWAQQPVSVSGTASDARTGTPLAGATVTAFAASTQVEVNPAMMTRGLQATTDAQGHYTLRDMPPGQYSVSVRTADQLGSFATRVVSVAPGRDVKAFDFHVTARGTIRGKVTNEAKLPVPGATVLLVVREYQGGQLRTLVTGSTQANEKGEFTLPGVEAGRAYRLLSEKRVPIAGPVSNEARDLKLRKRVSAPTFYPNAADVDSASTVTLLAGEQRDAVNIQMRSVTGQCIEATLDAAGAPTPLMFWVQAEGLGNGPGTFLPPPGGMTAADGRLRVCGLAPGNYRLAAIHMLQMGAKEVRYGSSSVTIDKADVSKVRVSAQGGTELKGEVVWDGDIPAAATTTLTVGLTPIHRAPLQGERRDGGRSPIPGKFTIAGVLRDDYMVRINVDGPGVYVKDVQFAGASVLHTPLRMGLSPDGAGLRIVVARDGGVVRATTTSGARVVVMPASAASEAELAGSMVSALADQDGLFVSATLAPGKYYVLAVGGELDLSAETVGKLWRARNAAQAVDISAGGSATVQVIAGEWK